MLLNFTLGNWMSYRDEASLSMISSLERQHGETRSALPGFRNKKILPVAAVYGGNASGKTALFKGLAALREMVLTDPGVDGLLPVQPFMLDSKSAADPTMFDITFLAGETTYRLVVEATRFSVVYESLEVVKEGQSIDVYERDASAGEYFKLNREFFSDSDHVMYAAKSTRTNQVFLGAGFSQNVGELSEPFRWFAETLELVGVESQAWSFATAATGREDFLRYAGEALSRMDTGICGLVGERVEVDALPPDARLLKKASELKEDETITVVADRAPGDYGFEMLSVRGGGPRPDVQRLRTLHCGPDGEVHSFGLSVESSGTQRLMGLLPMLFDLSGESGSSGSKVFVVDELDRCFHTMLTSRLIEDFLATCGPDKRKQLLFTTHDLLLMDQSLMRRDEMYITQRGSDGRSQLVALSDFEGIRFDKDLIKSYLEGRFGGIPMLGEVSDHG